MNRRLILLLALLVAPLGAAHAASAEVKNLRHLETSLEAALSEFEVACRAGNVESVFRKCDERLVKVLSDGSLSDYLGRGWKVESLTIKRKIIVQRPSNFRTVALVLVEVSERDATRLQAMLWVLNGSEWRCRNLPFEHSTLPPTVKFHFLSDDELAPSATK